MTGKGPAAMLQRCSAAARMPPGQAKPWAWHLSTAMRRHGRQRSGTRPEKPGWLAGWLGKGSGKNCQGGTFSAASVWPERGGLHADNDFAETQSILVKIASGASAACVGSSVFDSNKKGALQEFARRLSHAPQAARGQKRKAVSKAHGAVCKAPMRAGVAGCRGRSTNGAGASLV